MANRTLSDPSLEDRALSFREDTELDLEDVLKVRRSVRFLV